MAARRVGIAGTFLGLLAFMAAASCAFAAIAGPCSDCHTMHHSQGGTVLETWRGGPHPMLLSNDCIGCHTDPAGNLLLDPSGVPLVNQSAAPAGRKTLAGGSFYWVAAGADAKGHNVVEIGPADAALGQTPPGFGSGEAAPDGNAPGTNWANHQLSCAGTYGCHGTHAELDPYRSLGGAHHRNASGQVAAGAAPGEGFRFLQGVKGYEDADWENTAADGTTDHNQYYGADGGNDRQTISAFCARCHGDYHGSSETQSSGAWLRHPTDYDMGNTPIGSEYRGYGGAGDEYRIVTPVASQSVAAPRATVTFSDDTIVTCLSCHRAHGSPYAKMMRWDYASSPFGADCSNCHTSKN